MIKKREFINASKEKVVIEEITNDNGDTTSYKQWNNDILIIHRVWDYDENNRQILYHDITEDLWYKKTHHFLNGFHISNEWSNTGRWCQSWNKVDCIKEGGKINYYTCYRFVADGVDTGFKKGKLSFI